MLFSVVVLCCVMLFTVVLFSVMLIVPKLKVMTESIFLGRFSRDNYLRGGFLNSSVKCDRMTE